ncbi:membrane protein [Actibacterium mucosum KCTC 23349]|uniref:Membrane protein n=1 Tax=Actibacterium mucosum KCTC 23349 TaxID=1454373 RepID=A0A037ZLU6_9RHOB|nr:NAD(P)/FAD-dependent oxidoreductase [Actibacterium mucosum]KAJ56619.1 membrane protein [Actibacterium mucosum KCTC 23349]
MQDVKTLILGAGAAGMMCAIHAGAGTLVIDHAKAPGEKIRISGGGRCNFTNTDCGPGNFLSANRHFAKSALARYTQWDFIELVSRHNIAWHEKTLGQLFCDNSAKDIIAMLLAEMDAAGARLRLGVSAGEITHDGAVFRVTLSDGSTVRARNLVVATGGKSIPKMGATGFGYDVARQFGHDVLDTRPALVPLTFGDRFSPLSGVSLPVQAAANGTAFNEAMLFTHRGLSGPAILQISSFWREGEAITVDLMPGRDAFGALRALRQNAGGKAMATMLADLIPTRLAQALATDWALPARLADCSDKTLRDIGARLNGWTLTPTGSEGYRTAEVTLGGVDTAQISSRSMESTLQPGLFFIGEVLDVTGWLGGYNFQWAWSSGHAAGTEIARRA